MILLTEGGTLGPYSKSGGSSTPVPVGNPEYGVSKNIADILKKLLKIKI